MRLSQVFIVVTFSATILFSQEESKESSDSLYFQFDPDSLYLSVGDSAVVTIRLLKNEGESANSPFYIHGGKRGTVSVYPRISDSTGVANVLVKVYRPGDLSLNVRSISTKRLDRVKDKMPITVPYPPLARIEFDQSFAKMYEGTSVQFKATVYDDAGLTRDETDLTFTTTNSSVAKFDDFGNLNAKSTGRVKVIAQVDNVTNSVDVRVVKNPVRGMELSSSVDEVRTGDVVHFKATNSERCSSILLLFWHC
ncbi:MAG TPA: Ig-like domain-containing protein [Candidatus Marinimicrobia bacterium]|nr:Ig-like domain-containing protein [Candidatus Neomarinimicrobiota bacterium]